MIVTIKSPAGHYGHLDGGVAAERGGESSGDRAFVLRAARSRLDESDVRAYAEAFDAQRALLSAWRLIESGGAPC